MAFIGLRLSDRTTQMLDEMAESTGLTRQEVLRVAIAVLYRVYNGQPVGAETQPASKFETAPQDAVRSQQEAQGDEEEELDDSQDVLEGRRDVVLEEERKKRKKEKKKRKRR